MLIQPLSVLLDAYVIREHGNVLIGLPPSIGILISKRVSMRLFRCWWCMFVCFVQLLHDSHGGCMSIPITCFPCNWLQSSPHHHSWVPYLSSASNMELWVFCHSLPMVDLNMVPVLFAMLNTQMEWKFPTKFFETRFALVEDALSLWWTEQLEPWPLLLACRCLLYK